MEIFRSTEISHSRETAYSTDISHFKETAYFTKNSYARKTAYSTETDISNITETAYSMETHDTLRKYILSHGNITIHRDSFYCAAMALTGHRSRY